MMKGPVSSLSCESKLFASIVSKTAMRSCAGVLDPPNLPYPNSDILSSALVISQ